MPEILSSYGDFAARLLVAGSTMLSTLVIIRSTRRGLRRYRELRQLGRHHDALSASRELEP